MVDRAEESKSQSQICSDSVQECSAYQVCKNFLGGKCKRGKDCKYRHDGNTYRGPQIQVRNRDRGVRGTGVLGAGDAVRSGDVWNTWRRHPKCFPDSRVTTPATKIREKSRELQKPDLTRKDRERGKLQKAERVLISMVDLLFSEVSSMSFFFSHLQSSLMH